MHRNNWSQKHLSTGFKGGQKIHSAEWNLTKLLNSGYRTEP